MKEIYKEEEKQEIGKNYGKCIKYVKCPQCKEFFQLKYEEMANRPDTLTIRSCPSGGVYDVRICCPFCDYEEEL